MKKSIHRAICFLFAVLAVCALFPVSVFAVDPVSAGVMANAFAQAIAAYGASNGVAMTFDVASTDGIGESVHELWKDFRDGTQDADDYATLAAALFPDLYYKASVVVGGVADVYSVGYNITSEYAEEFDNFYNWLLSGPAEMVQVDNQYYQFGQAQIGANAIPLNVYSGGGIPTTPILLSGLSNQQNFEGSLPVFSYTWQKSVSQTYVYTSGVYSTSDAFHVFVVPPNYVYAVSESGSGTFYFVERTVLNGGSPTFKDSSTHSILSVNSNYPGLTYGSANVSSSYIDWAYYVPSYSSVADGLAAIAGGATGDSVGVKAYSNTGIASFPDTADPNYDATHRTKQIPSTIPWDDALYGDGTGALTGAQSEAIAAEADAAIADDGILTLAGSTTADPDPGDPGDDPSDDPDDYLAVGLEDFFPFCIPFDIYNFLSALAADPVAPHFTATLDFPEAVGGTQTIELDFDSPTWNQLAQLLRLLELLAFIVGLALLTRSMFIRG